MPVPRAEGRSGEGRRTPGALHAVLVISPKETIGTATGCLLDTGCLQQRKELVGVRTQRLTQRVGPRAGGGLQGHVLPCGDQCSPVLTELDEEGGQRSTGVGALPRRECATLSRVCTLSLGLLVITLGRRSRVYALWRICRTVTPNPA